MYACPIHYNVIYELPPKMKTNTYFLVHKEMIQLLHK